VEESPAPARLPKPPTFLTLLILSQQENGQGNKGIKGVVGGAFPAQLTQTMCFFDSESFEASGAASAGVRLAVKAPMGLIQSLKIMFFNQSYFV
jgi:hypothetical protein